MNEIVYFGIYATVVVIGIVVAAWVRFGKGLVLRLFGWICPIVGIVSYTTFIVGKLGISVLSISIASVIAFPAIVGGVFMLRRRVVKTIRQQVFQLTATNQQISSMAQQTSTTATEQTYSITQLSVAADEMDQMAGSASKAANEVMQIAEQVVEVGREGVESTNQAVRIIDLIDQSSSFLESIKALAEQSNLLAVNASIEASKAGHHGLGFAVVAGEVRNLASQSKNAVKQVQKALDLTKEGKLAIADVARAIENMSSVNVVAADRARHISGVVGQQAMGAKQIADAMDDLQKSSKDTASASDELARSVDELNQIGSTLQTFVGK
jgi:methyl-accepting chemotaxis protein